MELCAFDAEICGMGLVRKFYRQSSNQSLEPQVTRYGIQTVENDIKIQIPEKTNG